MEIRDDELEVINLLAEAASDKPSAQSLDDLAQWRSRVGPNQSATAAHLENCNGEGILNNA